MNKNDLIYSKAFCIYPWIHFYAISNGNIYPCCSHDSAEAISHIHNKTINTILNEEAFKTLRLKMMRGEVSENFCKKCIDEEKIDITSSARYAANNYYLDFEDVIQEVNNMQDDGAVSGALRYLDIRISNLCNVMCQTCDGTFSSSLNSKITYHNDRKKIKGLTKIIDKNDLIFEQLKNPTFLGNLKKIYFAGGEPLISIEHYEILQRLMSVNTDIFISYNTNFLKTKYRNFDVLDMWNSFEKLDVSISIDDIGHRYEYIRYPSKFSTLLDNCKNFHRIVNNSYSKLSVTVTVSFLNIFHLDNLIDFLISEKIVESADKIHLYPLINPQSLSITVLPKKIKQIVEDKLNNICEKYSSAHLTSSIIFIIDTMNSADNSDELGKTFKKINYNEQVRCQISTLSKVFEEYYLLLTGCSV